MAVTLNAKGTSVSTFMVGKAGPSLNQNSSITVQPSTDFTINLDENQNLVIDAGATGPALITVSNDQDLHINPATGGGQYLVLVANRWPTADGTSGQVITTNGLGVLSFSSPPPSAPYYQAFVATASQTVFNTTMSTVAAAAGRSYLQVFVNGVLQQEGETLQFTVTGANQITFNTGRIEDDNVAIFGYA